MKIDPETEISKIIDEKEKKDKNDQITVAYLPWPWYNV